MVNRCFMELLSLAVWSCKELTKKYCLMYSKEQMKRTFLWKVKFIFFVTNFLLQILLGTLKHVAGCTTKNFNTRHEKQRARDSKFRSIHWQAFYSESFRKNAYEVVFLKQNFRSSPCSDNSFAKRFCQYLYLSKSLYFEIYRTLFLLKNNTGYFYMFTLFLKEFVLSKAVGAKQKKRILTPTFFKDFVKYWS